MKNKDCFNIASIDNYSPELPTYKIYKIYTYTKMATALLNQPPPLSEPAIPSLKPIELSFPLPKTPHTSVHIHLTPMNTSTMVFLSTTTPGDSGSTMKPMGSFVYAMPDVSPGYLKLIIIPSYTNIYKRTNPKSTISTILCNSAGSIEYATRTAKVLARRTALPVYVGCNIDPVVTGTTVEEEMEGFKKIVDAIMARWEGSR